MRKPLLCELSRRAHHDGRDLRAGGVVLRHELVVVALEDARAAGPLESGDGVLGDLEGIVIAEDIRLFTDGDVRAVGLGIAVEDRCDLFAGYGQSRSERGIGDAVDDLVLDGPEERGLIVSVGGNVREAVRAGDGGAAREGGT